jgi:hypothetical protein
LWDESRRTLYLGHIVVKRFRRPAPDLELLVETFQKHGWIRRIDDPLSRRPGIHLKQRLHDTIKNLNRSLDNPLIRFYGDGTGRGICWEFNFPDQP